MKDTILFTIWYMEQEETHLYLQYAFIITQGLSKYSL